MNKKTPTEIQLDGIAADALRPAGNGTILTAADASDALAICAQEYAEATAALEQAEALVAEIADGPASLKSSALALRDEAERRAREIEKYNADVNSAGFEVARIYPDLSGRFVPLRAYARGEVKIDQPLEYVSVLSTRTHTPNITDANRELARAFRPVLRGVPNTAAIRVEPIPYAVALRDLVRARERLEKAEMALADALGIFDGIRHDLRLEAEAEADSVQEAINIQRERNAKK